MKPKIAGYALRLPASLKEEAERLAAGEGASLNRFIVDAVAEKVSSLSGAGGVSNQNARAGAARASVEKDEVAGEDA